MTDPTNWSETSEETRGEPAGLWGKFSPKTQSEKPEKDQQASSWTFSKQTPEDDLSPKLTSHKFRKETQKDWHSLTKTGLWEGKGKMSKVNLTILPIKKENSSWWTDKTTEEYLK